MKIDKLKTCERFCEEAGNDINEEVCREVENELKNCPKCRVFYDSIKKTVELYQITEKETKLEASKERKLFKILELDCPK